MCDTLCALGPAATGASTVFAKNSDRPRSERQKVVRSAPRTGPAPVRTTYLEVEAAAAPTLAVLGTGPDWMWGLEQGVNEAGVAVGNERVWTDQDPRGEPDALTGMDLVRLGLERGGTAAEALEVVVELLERYGQGGACHPGGLSPYWSSFLLADRDRAFVLETSGRSWASEEVRGSRAISNRLTIPAFEAEHGIDSGGLLEALVDPRLEASRAALAAGPFDVDRAMAHLRSHAGAPDGHTVCMHTEAEATTASLVARLDGTGSEVWIALGSPCESEYQAMDLVA